MRKITLLLLTLLVTLTFAGTALAEPTNINDALKTANDELRDKNYGTDFFRTSNINTKPINNSLWESRRLFVYAQPYGMDPTTGNNRYLGETMKGEAYTNTLFRHDAWEGGTINDRNWIPTPWKDDKVKAYLIRNSEQTIKNNPFNNNPEYLSSIKRGIKEYFPKDNPMIYFKDDSTQWHNYVHVLQPPTKYAWGMGRMWHKDSSGNIWYLTIPMAPLLETKPIIPDLSTKIEVDRFTNVKPGDKITFKVTFMLNEDHPQSEVAWLRLHHVIRDSEYPITLVPLDPADALDASGFVTLQPGETKTYEGTFTVSDKPSKIVSRINPVNTDQDLNWANNRDEAIVTMDNLWVEILNYDQEAEEGGTASVTARLHNDKGELLVSRLVWKVNGTVVKDVPNYDLIGALEDSITFDMTASDAVVTVEINPDRDRPNNEISYEDNKASCTVASIPAESEFQGSVRIVAPDVWDAMKPLPFKVIVEDYLPYGTKRTTGSDGKTRTKSVSKSYNITANTSGEGILTVEWDPFDPTGGYQKTQPVKQNWHESYTKSSGSYTKTFSYTFPMSGKRGMSESTVVLKASVTHAGSAQKVVKIKPAPVKRPDLLLTK